MPLDQDEIDRRISAFDDIEIPHPRLSELKTAVKSLAGDTIRRIARNDAKLAKADGRPVKLDELWFMPLIGPSGSGKSFSIQKVVEAGYEAAGDDTTRIPVLPVTLRTSTKSPRQLQHQILEAYGDPSAQLVLRERDFSEALANKAIRDIARVRGTTIIILDEAHNLLTNAGHHAPLVMAKAIKSLLNDGLFSVVLAGTDKMMPLLTADPELRSRQRLPIQFTRHGLTTDDCRYFMDFVAHFERQMKDSRVIDDYIGLTNGIESCATTYDMADGVFGIVVRIIRLALERSLGNAKPSITWQDVALAYRSWISVGEVEVKKRRDPFAKGPSTDSVAAMGPLFEKKEGQAA